MAEFRISHGSPTPEQALQAAANFEAIVGRAANGDRKAFGELSLHDVAVMIQYIRNTAEKEKAA